jgi:hypothetical protein
VQGQVSHCVAHLRRDKQCLPPPPAFEPCPGVRLFGHHLGPGLPKPPECHVTPSVPQGTQWLQCTYQCLTYLHLPGPGQVFARCLCALREGAARWGGEGLAKGLQTRCGTPHAPPCRHVAWPVSRPYGPLWLDLSESAHGRRAVRGGTHVAPGDLGCVRPPEPDFLRHILRAGRRLHAVRAWNRAGDFRRAFSLPELIKPTLPSLEPGSCHRWPLDKNERYPLTCTMNDYMGPLRRLFPPFPIHGLPHSYRALHWGCRSRGRRVADRPSSLPRYSSGVCDA